tara:strand:- start:250 stop:474 length:225 start_codon:yes stop_codon:yes gene_type:complete
MKYLVPNLARTKQLWKLNQLASYLNKEVTMPVGIKRAQLLISGFEREMGVFTGNWKDVSLAAKLELEEEGNDYD